MDMYQIKKINTKKIFFWLTTCRRIRKIKNCQLVGQWLFLFENKIEKKRKKNRVATTRFIACQKTAS